MRYAPKPARTLGGFTLMELMIVLLIIGILLAFILGAASQAVRAAEESATRALISKLDSGMADRLEALLNQRMDPSQLYPMASINTVTTAACINFAYVTDPTRAGYSGGAVEKSALQRSGVLLRYEQLKIEIPDVFAVQATGANASYPLNFAMTPYAFAGVPVDFQTVTPVGINGPPPVPPQTGLGIWGASYTAHAAVYKNLGKFMDPNTGVVGPGIADKGFDGVDNNGNFLIDDIGEWGSPQTDALNNHQHITARAEMLYALLVEGQGPYGSVFNRDDFTDKEVRDTDLDGLPEFVDGWGKPLQFYRWPTFYHSDLQRGLPFQQDQPNRLDANGNAVYTAMPPYFGPIDAREQDPLDPNQQLTMPDWWSATYNPQASAQFSASVPLSGAGVYFQTYFHQLVEPLAGLGSTGAVNQLFWDRSNPNVPGAVIWPRRAFYSRYLILSAGPDGQPGVPFLTDAARASGAYGTSPSSPPPPIFANDGAMKAQLASTPALAALLLMRESQAAQATLIRSNDIYQTPQNAVPGGSGNGDPYTNQLQVDGQDDITNHNLYSSALPVQ